MFGFVSVVFNKSLESIYELNTSMHLALMISKAQVVKAI
jgi:hypothetical protein